MSEKIKVNYFTEVEVAERVDKAVSSMAQQIEELKLIVERQETELVAQRDHFDSIRAGIDAAIKAAKEISKP